MPIEAASLYDSIFIKKHQRPFPSHLFHYTKTDNSKKIITNKEFHLSKYDKSNDVFEFRYGLNTIESVISQIQRLENHNKANILWDKFFKWFHEEKNNPNTIYFMGSFTVQDNRHLWKKYADNCRGKRLDFNFNIKDFDSLPFVAGPVLYAETKFRKQVRRIIYGHSDVVHTSLEKWQKNGSYDENMKMVICLMIRDLLVCAAFFKKHKHSIEKEYRIVIWGIDDAKSYETLSLKASNLTCCYFTNRKR